MSNAEQPAPADAERHTDTMNDSGLPQDEALPQDARSASQVDTLDEEGTSDADPASAPDAGADVPADPATGMPATTSVLAPGS